MHVPSLLKQWSLSFTCPQGSISFLLRLHVTCILEPKHSPHFPLQISSQYSKVLRHYSLHSTWYIQASKRLTWNRNICPMSTIKFYESFFRAFLTWSHARAASFFTEMITVGIIPVAFFFTRVSVRSSVKWNIYIMIAVKNCFLNYYFTFTTFVNVFTRFQT